VALTIALRTRTHATDLRSAAFSTREMIYRYLAEQIFSSLSLSQRAFALASCVFSSFDRTIAEALSAPPALLDEIRAKIAFLYETSPGEFRYHDLFREFLEMELRRSGEREWIQALCSGADILERRGDIGGALALYAKAHATVETLRIIEREGFSLFERGEAEKLAQALDVVPEDAKRSSAMATGLRAMIDAGRGRFEVAEPAFLAAIELAHEDDDLRLRLVHRYAIELVRLDRDCVGFLESYTGDGAAHSRYRAPLLATLATGYLHAGRRKDAVDAIEAALQLLDASVAEDSRARIYQQASYVERYAGSLDKARSYASSAIEFAFANNLYELAARAYSVLYTIARDTADDPIEALHILERLNESARKGASAHATLFALVARYEIEVERANDAALEAFDVEMRERETMLPQLRRTTVVAMDALRAAWQRDFMRAYALVAQTAREQSTTEQRALRAADAALYATAAGLQQEAERHLEEAAKAVTESTASSRHVIRARLTMALAYLLRGHDTAAHRLIADAERSLTPRMARVRAFAHAVRTLYRVHLELAPEQEFAPSLERLRAEHFGGIARLLEALPLAATEGTYAALTPAEREVLQLLAKGASTKDVAARTGRSPHTVDTHIRSICRKLGCSGRREAVALASSRGWVEA
jgi:ATP/maltotriose-dependent transcriptional regulator MalT